MRGNRKFFLAVVISLVACSFSMGVRAAAAAGPKRPNILFLYSDDHSYKTVSCYPEAYPFAKTPHIDALAACGVRFTHCYLGSWCMPSRASLLTGRHPHGIESMRMEGKYPGSAYDPQQCPFWPAEARKHGYQTAQLGKWHTGIDTGFGRDWDYQVVWNRPLHPENAGNYFYDQILSTNGKESPQLEKEYSTDHYTQLACDYISGRHREADKPWYLWLCYGAIHGPTTPAKRHIGHYKQADVPTPADIFGPRPGKPSYLEKTQSWFKDSNGEPRMGKSDEAFGDESQKNPRTHAQWVRQVNECVLALDEGIGKVMAALKESGQLENTLVVFTADQGFASGEHGCRSKICPYDANYRSPLIFSQPGTLPEGVVCAQSVNAPDLVVTFHALAGLELPWNMHGRDLTPLLKNPTADWPFATFYTHMGQHYGSDTAKLLAAGGDEAVHSNVPWYVALREKNYKYIRYLKDDEIEELYDLADDPEELSNLAYHPTQTERMARMRELLMAELKRTEAPFLDHLPPAAQSLK